MAITSDDHLVNFEALKMAALKTGFVPAGAGGMDPGGGAPGGAPGGGPQGPPPGGPPPGGDPSGGGGAPPPDAGGGGGGGGFDPSMLAPMINQAVAQAMQSQGAMGGGQGGAGAAGGQGLKPKIDVNVEIMQVKNILAKIADHLGIQIPAQDMVATPEKLTAMAQGQSTATPAGTGGPPGGDPSGGAGGAIGGMPPMGGMQPAGMPGGEKMGAARLRNGAGFGNAAVGLQASSNMATAIMAKRRARDAA